MSLDLYNLAKNNPGQIKKKRIGRGDSSGHGTYAGRGSKGQRARSGGRKGLTRRGLQPTLKGIPKKRGVKSFFPKKVTMNINELNDNFKEGEKVTLQILLAKKLVKYSPAGLKILGEGKITKKLFVYAKGFSKKAEEAIVKAGGQAIKV
jgi:large subunit ribosomal protein L15